MKPHHVDAVFVGYEDQENLGLRYVMAYLEANGCRCALVPYPREDPRLTVDTVRRLSPSLVGFSIIFQYTLPDFGRLLRDLRAADVTAHFTAGGHYPSLCPESTLRALPELDSIVRFEGELTALDLFRHLPDAGTWTDIQGLAFRRKGSIVVNPPRRLVDDLDELPWPVRTGVRQTCRGLATAPILASRGCHFDCAFCSIREFYGRAPGRTRRTRSAADVVAEMAHLHRTMGVRLFLFQDDDFAFRSRAQRTWVGALLDQMDASGLTDRIGWKISCRVDDVDIELMTRCREHGLLVVYLGVESGNDAGLATLNKRVTAAVNLAVMNDLKEAGIEFDMGFMLFDPDSTFESVRGNLEFLRQVAALGGPPLSFVKMLPLAGTAIQRRLEAECRLTGTAIRPDYDLLDARLDYYALFVTLTFSHRNSDPHGLVEKLRLAHFDAVVADRFEPSARVDEYRQCVRRLVDRANRSVLDTLELTLAAVEACASADEVAQAWPLLNRLAEPGRVEDDRIAYEIDRVLARYSPTLCSALGGDESVA